MNNWNPRSYDEWKSQKDATLMVVNTGYLICDLCHSKDSNFTMKCMECSKRFGKNCGIKSEFLCKDCINFDDIDFMQNSLPKIFIKNTCIQDINIINIIKLYCKGHIISCCNKVKCENEIHINDKFEFLQTKNLYNFQKKYYWYSITKNQKESDIEYIFNLKIRIFCKDCTQYLHLCTYLYIDWNHGHLKQNRCENVELYIQNGLPVIDYSQLSDSRYFDMPIPSVICKKHIFCERCGDQQEINTYGLYDKCSRFGTYYCFKCAIIYDKCCSYKYHAMHDSDYNTDNEDIYDKYNDELSRYDADPVFIKTCKPYKL